MLEDGPDWRNSGTPKAAPVTAVSNAEAQPMAPTRAIVLIQGCAFLEESDRVAPTNTSARPRWFLASIYETSSMLPMWRLLPVASRVPAIFTCLPSYCFARSWSSSWYTLLLDTFKTYLLPSLMIVPVKVCAAGGCG